VNVPKSLAATLFLFAASAAAPLAGCSPKAGLSPAGQSPAGQPKAGRPARTSLSQSARNDAKLLFKMLVTLEALEPVTGGSMTWKAAVNEMPDSKTVGLLDRTLGGGRFTSYDVEAGTKVYRARFAEAATGDPAVEILWSIDSRNYPVSIGAPEGYREARVTDYLDRGTKTLTGWNDGVIDLVVTPDPVVIVWDKAVKAPH